MIKKFELFEMNYGEPSSIYFNSSRPRWAGEYNIDIQYPSNKTWYKEHSKIYSKEEEDNLLKNLLRDEEKIAEINKASIGKEDVDPYGEENWSDDELVRLGLDKSIIKSINIIKERLKILRSFKENENLTNEELGWKTALAGAALASTLTFAGCDTHKGFAKLDKTEQVGKQTFKTYELYAEGQGFDLTIRENFMVARHSYTERHGSGKNEHTDIITVTNLFIPAGVKFIWYYDKTFGRTYASPKPFTESHLIKMSDLEVHEDNSYYTIYKMKGFFSSSPFNNIIVIKKGGKIKGEDFKFTDKQLGIYTIKRINRDLYIIDVKGIGEGKFGGAGAGGEF